MIHVGISGPIASGKSTLAIDLKTLAIEHDYQAEVVPFAYGIRELVALEGVKYRRAALTQKLFAWGYDTDKATEAASMIDETMNKYPSAPGVKNRRLLQIIGTEIGREFLGEDTWIIRTQQIARKYEALDFLFSDDLRFDNEAMAVDVHIALVARGGMSEYIYKERIKTLGDGYVYNDHASERSLTLPPLFEVNVGFSKTAVNAVFTALDRIRRLRH